MINNRQEERKLTIPYCLMGIIIGKRGSYIKEFANSHHPVMISIASEEQDEAKPNISLTGIPAEVERAYVTLYKKLRCRYDDQGCRRHSCTFVHKNPPPKNQERHLRSENPPSNRSQQAHVSMSQQSQVPNSLSTIRPSSQSVGSSQQNQPAISILSQSPRHQSPSIQNQQVPMVIPQPTIGQPAPAPNQVQPVIEQPPPQLMQIQQPPPQLMQIQHNQAPLSEVQTSHIQPGQITKLKSNLQAQATNLQGPRNNPQEPPSNAQSILNQLKPILASLAQVLNQLI